MKERGEIRRRIHPDPFPALVRTIIGQQISSRAQDTIWTRLQEAIDNFSPQALLALPPEALRKCGISGRKISYIREVAMRFHTGELESEKLKKMNDEDIISVLTTSPGIGLWTAEMMLIFTFLRKNVLSYGDLAIRRGLMRLKGTSELPKNQFNIYKELYTPFGTLASLYLWEIAADNKAGAS